MSLSRADRPGSHSTYSAFFPPPGIDTARLGRGTCGHCIGWAWLNACLELVKRQWNRSHQGNCEGKRERYMLAGQEGEQVGRYYPLNTVINIRF